MSWNGGSYSINPTTQGNRSSGYDTYNDVIGAVQGGGFLPGDSGASNRGGAHDDKWTRWFGVPPYSNFQRDNYADLGHENYTLPTAYVGRNLHIEKLLNVSIASTDDFYTRVLLPWQQYDGMRVTWSKWSGFDHLMTQVPEEVPAPQIQTRFESGEAYQQRYGLAFKMEHGFQKTQMGQQAYAMNLAIITQAVLRTVYARVMQVLVQQRNFLAVVAGSNYSNDMARAREISKGSTLTFGALQKNTFGFDNALASVMKLFENRRLALPDAVVIPHGSFGVLKMCKPESRTYAICGDLATRLDMKSTRDFVSNIYNNQFQIFEHRPMNISQDSNEVNMLTRDRDVGNVFRIFRDGTTYAGHKSNDVMPTAIQIVDHDKQRWRTITLVEALKKSGAFYDDDEHKSTDTEMKGTLDTDFVTKSGWFQGSTNTTNKKYLRFGDIKIEYLNPMLSEVRRSIDAYDRTHPGKPAKDFGATSAWSKGAANAPTEFYAPVGGEIRTANVIPEASVADVASAIIGSAVASNDAIASDADVVSAAEELASVTTEQMPARLRGALVETIGSSGASLFSKSRKVVKSIQRNTNASKAGELKNKLLDSIKSDFRSGWSDLSKSSRDALRQNEIEIADATSATEAAAPIGASANAAILTSDSYSWWLEVPCTIAAIRALDEMGIVTPFGAYVFRPFQSFEMGSMIVMKAGTDTGMTVVGNSDFQLGDSVTNKTHLGHFTFYFESVVHEPNHIMTVRDAMFMKYNGGAGAKFYNWPFTHTSTSSGNDGSESLFAVIALHCESYDEYHHDPIDLSGSFATGSALAPLQPQGDKPLYLAAGFYGSYFAQAGSGLMGQTTFDGHDSTTQDAGDIPFYVDNPVNRVCYQGLQSNRGASNEFDRFTTNTGHLGDSESVDSSLTWSGHMSLKTSVAYHVQQNTAGFIGRST